MKRTFMTLLAALDYAEQNAFGARIKFVQGGAEQDHYFCAYKGVVFLKIYQEFTEKGNDVFAVHTHEPSKLLNIFAFCIKDGSDFIKGIALRYLNDLKVSDDPFASIKIRDDRGQRHINSLKKTADGFVRVIPDCVYFVLQSMTVQITENDLVELIINNFDYFKEV